MHLLETEGRCLWVSWWRVDGLEQAGVLLGQLQSFTFQFVGLLLLLSELLLHVRLDL